MRIVKRAFCAAVVITMLFLVYGCDGEFLSSTYSGEAHDFSVMFVNCGKADCAIVVTDGLAWLIDCGTEESFPNIYASLSVLGIEELEGIMITHCHDDHIGGLEAVLQRYKVKSLYSPELLLDSSEVSGIAAEYSIQHERLSAGESVPIVGSVSFEVIAPIKLDPSDDNDNSLVLRLFVNGRTFLFTGDMQKTEERTLIESGEKLSADVLKVGNHGNPDATSKDFAIAVSPKIAVISTDTSADTDSANPKVLQRLGSADVYVTQDYDLGILITVAHDGNISVSYPERPAAKGEIDISVDLASKEYQTVTIVNNGAEADISGWFIYSSKGYEVFNFPKGTVIHEGGSITVAGIKGAAAAEADYIWNEKTIWAKNKSDHARLCDNYGNPIDEKASE